MVAQIGSGADDTDGDKGDLIVGRLDSSVIDDSICTKMMVKTIVSETDLIIAGTELVRKA